LLSQVYYGSKSCTVRGVSSSLDHDTTTGYGPETITVNGMPGQLSGPLQHFVYIYAGNPPVFRSDAVVSLYGATGLLSTLVVPVVGSSARYWATWNLRSADSFDVVNQVVSTKPGT
jgi:hypothetical protein